MKKEGVGEGEVVAIGHPQVLVQTNTPVDEGIAPLVVALNQFPGILTVDSCQGGGKGLNSYVAFDVESHWHALAEFVHQLSHALRSRIDGDLGYSLSVEWFAGGECLAYIRTGRKNIQAFADAILAIAESGLKPILHNSECFGGTECTMPHN